MGRKNFYAVACGREPGVYATWAECQEQVSGFSGADYKGFQTTKEAHEYVAEKGGGAAVGTSHHPQAAVGTGRPSSPAASVSNQRPGTAGATCGSMSTCAMTLGAPYMGGSRPTSAASRWASRVVAPAADGATAGGAGFFQDDMHASASLHPRPADTSATGGTGTDRSDSSRPGPVDSVKLHALQKKAVDMAQAGLNVFLTGVAGTGKSKVTHKIIADAKAAGKTIAVAAPTGVAAINVGGTTLHKVCKIRVATNAGDFGAMYSTSKADVRKMDMLILDEVGMINADFLDFLDVEVRSIRGVMDKVFGGIQLVFIGDFAQLSPIANHASMRRDQPMEPTAAGSDIPMEIEELNGYAFQTACWREADFQYVRLTHCYRQENDEQMREALMDIREGRGNTAAVQWLCRECSRVLPDEEVKGSDGRSIKAITLHSCNKYVDLENRNKLNELAEELHIFTAQDSVQVDQYCGAERGSTKWLQIEKKLELDKFFSEQCLAREEVELKVGAQVMLLANLIEDPPPPRGQNLVNGSQGTIMRFEASDEVQSGFAADTLWPVVAFRTGKNITRERRIVPTVFERDIYRQGVCYRSQVPLRLAWAITIHKSQGMTLPYVRVDLNGCFATGQAYVALSRAKSSEGLQIINFASGAVKADDLVTHFYATLENEIAHQHFLCTEGLWWYPVCFRPRWLQLFKGCQGCRSSSATFSKWLEKYPLPQGWLPDEKLPSRRARNGPAPPQNIHQTQPVGAAVVSAPAGGGGDAAVFQPSLAGRGHESSSNDGAAALRSSLEAQLAQAQQQLDQNFKAQQYGRLQAIQDQIDRLQQALRETPSSPLLTTVRLSPEQRQQIEQNREAALLKRRQSSERRRQQQQRQQQQRCADVTSPETVGRSCLATGMTRPTLCKFGCQHPVAPGQTQRGRPFDTCCRHCAMSQGRLQAHEHDVACHARWQAWAADTEGGDRAKLDSAAGDSCEGPERKRQKLCEPGGIAGTAGSGSPPAEAATATEARPRAALGRMLTSTRTAARAHGGGGGGGGGGVMTHVYTDGACEGNPGPGGVGVRRGRWAVGVGR
jgi:ATP-dependent DNA helicase PIF1